MRVAIGVLVVAAGIGVGARVEQQPRPAAPPMSLIEARVAEYEARVRAGTASPSDLAAIGEAVVAAERASRDRAIRVAACASTSIDRTPECTRHLAAAAADDTLPWPVRLTAAAARVRAGEKDAAGAFDHLAAAAPVADLLTAIDLIRSMPARHAVPPLLRMLESSDERVQAAGSGALGDFDTPETHYALRRMTDTHAPGTDVWASAMVGRARLGDTDAGSVVGSAHAYFSAEVLLGAAQALGTAGDPRAAEFLRLVTRKGAPLQRFRAALLLPEAPEETASAALDSILRDDKDPEVRAKALALYASRALPLPPAVPRLLTDPAPIVRLRAAELAIAWARRQPR
jgi:HEAT repeat protein